MTSVRHDDVLSVAVDGLAVNFALKPSSAAAAGGSGRTLAVQHNSGQALYSSGHVGSSRSVTLSH
jgi:hypothetical protein